MLPKLPDGYTVKYKYDRDIVKRERKTLLSDNVIFELASKGGTTTATIYDQDGNMAARGFARCRPDEQFNKRLGKLISLGRALKALEERSKYILEYEHGEMTKRFSGVERADMRPTRT
jgi:hypothetical protein